MGLSCAATGNFTAKKTRGRAKADKYISGAKRPVCQAVEHIASGIPAKLKNVYKQFLNSQAIEENDP